MRARLRGVPGGLGCERRRVGVLGRARRNGARRLRSAAARPARRGGRHDVGLAGRERDRLGAAARARRAHPDRDQRVRVPDDRADRACAGAPRRGGRARAPRCGRVDPGRAVRRRDRRAHGARLLHDDLVSDGAPARRRRDRRGRPRERRARARRQLPGRGRDRARRAGARRRLRHGRDGQVPARARPGSAFCGCAASCSTRLVPTQTGLVRRRGHLPHGHLRLLAARDAPAASTRARRRCRTSTRASPACR